MTIKGDITRRVMSPVDYGHSHSFMTMSIPFLLLHFLPLLLLSLVLCKKRKTTEKTTPIQKKKEEEAEPSTVPSSLPTESPLQVCKTQDDSNKSQKSQEERKRRREEIMKHQAKIIWNIKNEFNPKKYKPQTFSKEKMEKMKGHCEDLGFASQHFVKMEFEKQVKEDFRKTNTIYKNHKCPYPNKQKNQEDECDICRAYIDWAGFHYDHSWKEDKYPEGYREKLEDDLYNYKGKLPSIVEGTRWTEAKERIKKRRAGGETQKIQKTTQKSEISEERKATKREEEPDVEATQWTHTQQTQEA